MLYPSIQTDVLLSQLPMVNDAIDLGQLSRMPGGGTHEIYQLDKNPTFVLKVIKNSIGHDKATLENRLASLTEKYAKLYEVFGNERCLCETRSIQKVKYPDSPSEQSAIISLVAYDHCFKSQEKFGFNTEAVETKEPKLKANAARYHELNRILLGNNEELTSFSADEFLFFHESLKPFFNTLCDDAGLRIVVKEFLEKFKTYYTTTDQLLDFTGRDNVIFYKDHQGAWQYKVGSVIKNETGKHAVAMIAEIATHPACVHRAFEDWTHIFFVPSWARTVNAVAAQLGMPRVIDNITLSSQDSQNLAAMSEMLECNERAVSYAEENDFTKAHQLFEQHLANEKMHNTWIRHALGVLFWRHVATRDAKPSKEDIAVFLNMLTDEKNIFPEVTWKETYAAVAGLQSLLADHGEIDKKTLEKISFTLGKIGFQSEPILDKLLGTMQQLATEMALTNAMAKTPLSDVEPLIPLHEVAKAKNIPIVTPTSQAEHAHIASCK